MLFADRPILREKILTGSAVLAGLSVPALITGRAVLGVALGLSVILALVFCNHRHLKDSLKPLLRSPLAYLIYAAVIGMSVNVAFSLRIDLSWEAWARTYVIAGLCLVLVSALKDKMSYVMGAVTLFSCLFLVLSFAGIMSANKAFLNGLVLAVPIYFLWASQRPNKIWLIVPLVNLILIIEQSILHEAKASIAGLALMLLTSLIFYGIKYLKLRTLIILSALSLCAILAFIFWWVPQQMWYADELNAALLPLPASLIDAHRQLIWLFSLDLFTHSPWVGFGLNASNYHPDATMSIEAFFGPDFSKPELLANAQVLPGHPHSWVIEILLEAGLIGFIPFLISVIALFVVSIRTYLKKPGFGTLALLAIQFAFWGMGLINFSFWSVWWQVIYLLCSFTAFAVFYFPEQGRTCQTKVP